MIRVVLADANVLYSRVLRDHLVYASADGLVRLRWSELILDEMSRSLEARLGLAANQVERLRNALNEFLPEASVAPESEHYELFADMAMPDQDDRHVMAAAAAAGADVLCSLNTRDFPATVMRRVGVRLATPDALLCELIDASPHSMKAVHEYVLQARHGISSASVLDALERAQAPGAAGRLRELLGKSSSTGGSG